MYLRIVSATFDMVVLLSIIGDDSLQHIVSRSFHEAHLPITIGSRFRPMRNATLIAILNIFALQKENEQATV